MKDFKELRPLEFMKFAPRLCAGNGDLGSDALLRSILPPLVEEFSDGVAIARISGGNGPLLYVNRAFERLTGYARREVLGKDCRYLQGNERHQPEVARIGEAIRAAEPVDVTLRNHRKDGSVFWNHLSLRPFTVGGELLYLGILRDVSATRVNGGRIPGHRGGVKAGHWRWGAADMARAPIGALAISRCRG